MRTLTPLVILTITSLVPFRAFAFQPGAQEHGVDSGFFERLPPPNRNNVWYCENKNSDTVVVFIHGILSDSRTCWLYKSPTSTRLDKYWPEFVRYDPKLEYPSIYLAGYYTALDAGRYETDQASKAILDRLQEDGVLAHRRIIFIAHSTGGIVARYLLYHNKDAFRDKHIGLMLMASPSRGAYLANRVAYLIEIYHQQLGKELKVDNPFLIELDNHFRDLLEDHSLDIVGSEAVENHFIFHDKWIPDDQAVVTTESGSRYFGSPRILADTDHFSIVKPDSLDHVSHQFLVSFYHKFNDADIPPRISGRVPMQDRSGHIFGWYTITQQNRLLLWTGEDAGFRYTFSGHFITRNHFKGIESRTSKLTGCTIKRNYTGDAPQDGTLSISVDNAPASEQPDGTIQGDKFCDLPVSYPQKATWHPSP